MNNKKLGYPEVIINIINILPTLNAIIIIITYFVVYDTFLHPFVFGTSF